MFGKKFKLFSLFGFEVSVDLSWIFIALLVAWSLSTGLFPREVAGLSSTAYWIMGIVGAVGLFASIIVHEFAHSAVARSQGIPMKGITLFIFGGVAESGDEAKSPGDEFVMAVVGPVTSLVLAAIFYGVTVLGRSAAWPDPVVAVVGYLALINLVLGVFNCLPAFPLDGGRVLRSILWRIKGDLRWATRVSSGAGSVFGWILVGLGVLNIVSGNFVGGMWWVLIGLFLDGVARASYRQLVIRRALSGESLKRFMKTDPVTVPREATVRTLVEDYMYRHHYKMFPVTAGDELVGCVTTKEIRELPREDWDTTRVEQVMKSCDLENTVTPDTDAVEALSRMSQSGLSRLIVARNGRLEGVVTLKDMLDFLSFKIDLGITDLPKQ